MKTQNNSALEYLKPEVVSTLGSLELKARLLVEGFLVGLHKSPYHGFSVEFSEHRPYFQGDSLRYVDWKLFGKTEKYYVKKFEEETNLISRIIVDASASMKFSYGGRISKFEYAKLLAAAFAYLINKQHDAVGISFFSDKIENSLEPKASRTHLLEILKAVENQSPGKDTNIANSLTDIAKKIRKRGLLIIISDLFDEKDKIVSALKLFRYKKNEVIIFHILDPAELSLDFSDDAIFVDLENDEELSTQPYQIRAAYRKAVGDFVSELKTEALNFGIEYQLITTDVPFDKALLKYFILRNKLH
jgi:uncharacterized protein (DUF58 family)